MRGEHSLKVSALLLLLFVIYDIMKIGRKRLTDRINQSINNKAVCRTAPATRGLLNTNLFSFGQETLTYTQTFLFLLA